MKESGYLVSDPEESELTAGRVSSGTFPLVSFVVPTLNNEDTLDRCLRTIQEQKYPRTELVIVDGESEDRTIDIAERYTDDIYYDTGTYGSACQTGVEQSNGEILAMFDSDIYFPSPDWLQSVLPYFDYNPTVSTVWPRAIAPPNSSLIAKLYSRHSELIKQHRMANDRGLFGGGNSLIHREALEEVGGIDPEIHWGADFDWSARLRKAGYQVVYTSNYVYHDTMRSIPEFASTQFTGADTFTQSGFELLDLTFGDVLYEQCVLGAKGMANGLLNRRPEWLFFPIYMAIKTYAYARQYASNL